MSTHMKHKIAKIDNIDLMFPPKREISLWQSIETLYIIGRSVLDFVFVFCIEGDTFLMLQFI